jgi:hypothetical protein
VTRIGSHPAAISARSRPILVECVVGPVSTTAVELDDQPRRTPYAVDLESPAPDLEHQVRRRQRQITRRAEGQKAILELTAARSGGQDVAFGDSRQGPPPPAARVALEDRSEGGSVREAEELGLLDEPAQGRHADRCRGIEQGPVDARHRNAIDDSEVGAGKDGPVDRDPGPRSAPVGRRHLDGAGRVVTEPPESRGEVGGGCTGGHRRHRGQGSTRVRGGLVSDRVDAGVKGTQPSGSQPVCDRPSPDAEAEKLGASDDPPLARRRSDLLVVGLPRTNVVSSHRRRVNQRARA